MSTMASALQYSTLFGATYGADASGGDATLVTATLRDGSDTDGQVGHDAEVWGVACVVYRPDDPDDAGACQALTTQVGGTPVCLGTRDLRAVGAIPSLSRGDAAFVCPTGRGGVIVQKDGTITLLQRGKNGEPDALLVIEPDGAFNLLNPFGQMVLDADGWRVILKTGECMSLGDKQFLVSATTASISTATVALGVGAASPLAAVPLLPVATGGPAGFYSPVPVASIFVRPG
jgi:hypothetical protein